MALAGGRGWNGVGARPIRLARERVREASGERERRRLIGRPLDPVKPTWKAMSSKAGRGGRAASGERRIPVNRRV